MLNNIIKISKEAGSIIREGFGKNNVVEFKTDEGNLVTEIDKKAEKTIIDFVIKNYPTDSILAEEGGNKYGTSENLWVIDPLDGTTNYTHGLPIFSVSIGVIRKKEIIAGVVYDVMNDIAYLAEKGSGAFANEKRIEVSSNSKLGRSLLATGFAYNIKENPEHTFEKFAAITKSVRSVRRLGSAALDICHVAKGIYDGFWEVNLNPWDVCAGIIISKEAGGSITDFTGNETDIYSKQILVTNGKITESLKNLLNPDFPLENLPSGQTICK